MNRETEEKQDTSRSKWLVLGPKLEIGTAFISSGSATYSTATFVAGNKYCCRLKRKYMTLIMLLLWESYH